MKIRKNLAFLAILAVAVFVISSGSVDGRTMCDESSNQCCQVHDDTVEACVNCADVDDDSDCTEAYNKAAAASCAACQVMYRVPGSGGARFFSNETCVDFSKDQNDSLRVDSAANFEELSAGLDAGQSLNLGQGQSNEQLSVRMNEVSGSSGVVNVESTGQSYELTQGDVFKAGPSGNELVKFKGGSESGNERSAKMEYLGSACEGELRVLGKGDKLPVREEYFDKFGQTESEIVNYTIEHGLPPVDFSYRDMSDSEDITDIPMNRIRLEEIGYSNSPKVGTSIGGVTILDITNQNGEPKVIVCICDSNTGDGVVRIDASDVDATPQAPEQEVGGSPEVREDRQKKPSGPSEGQQGNENGFFKNLLNGNVVKNVFG